MVIDVRTRSTLVSSPPLTCVSCFTFYGDGDRVICATETGSLLSFHVSVSPTSWREYRTHVSAVHSICYLPNGHLMVGVEDCIQLLATESAQPSCISLDSGLSHAYPLDDGRAIRVSFRDRGIVGLLEMETMRTLARYDVRPHDTSSYHTPRVLCASIDGSITALCFPAYDGGCTLRLKNIGGTPFYLEQHLPRPPISAVLSPSGDNLIVVVEQGGSDEDRGWELWVWRSLKRSLSTPDWYAQNQYALYVRLDAQVGKLPSDIAFISETDSSTPRTTTPESPLLHPQMRARARYITRTAASENTSV